MGLFDNLLSRVSPAPVQPEEAPRDVDPWLEVCITLPDATYEGEMRRSHYELALEHWADGRKRVGFGMFIGGRYTLLGIEIGKATSLVAVAKANSNE